MWFKQNSCCLCGKVQNSILCHHFLKCMTKNTLQIPGTFEPQFVNIVVYVFSNVFNHLYLGLLIYNQTQLWVTFLPPHTAMMPGTWSNPLSFLWILSIYLFTSLFWAFSSPLVFRGKAFQIRWTASSFISCNEVLLKNRVQNIFFSTLRCKRVKKCRSQVSAFIL